MGPIVTLIRNQGMSPPRTALSILAIHTRPNPPRWN